MRLITAVLILIAFQAFAAQEIKFDINSSENRKTHLLTLHTDETPSVEALKVWLEKAQQLCPEGTSLDYDNSIPLLRESQCGDAHYQVDDELVCEQIGGHIFGKISCKDI